MKPQLVHQLQRVIEDSPQEGFSFKLGCNPSIYDPRDFKYPKILSAFGVAEKPPKIIDYRGNLPPVFNQGRRGSCVAAAAAWTVKAFQEMSQGVYPTGGFSVAYLYAMCKELDGSPNSEGTYPRTAMQVLKKHGISPESWMPYWMLRKLDPPDVPDIPASADSRADKFKIKTYAQICSPADEDRSGLLNTIRQALANEGPFLLALLVCDNFEPDANNRLPLPGGRVLGGHAVGIVGDLPDEKALILRNSWGPEWGMDGYALLPYEWLTTGYDFGRYVFEAWTSVDIVIPKPAARIEIKPGDPTMLVDGQHIDLDQPAIITNNRTMLPVRAVAGNMGYEVKWDGEKSILTIVELN